jgi:trk system potassium uptake protein TrkH
MNFSFIKYILGWIISFEAAFMLLPCIVAICYQEQTGLVFFVCALIFGLIGFLMVRKKPKSNVFYAKEGFVMVSLSWIILSIIGAIPFFCSSSFDTVPDALFEVISGFTTTGASILTDVETVPHCILFWRSFTQWIGGMGVLVFLLAILPMAGGQSIYLMRAESPGPVVEKIVPRLQHTAKMLYLIYTVLTLVEVVFLLAGGMNLFDSICTAISTTSTGGFGIYNSSVGGFNTYIQIVVTIFMFLSGVNFSFFYLLFFKRSKAAFQMEEVRCYAAIFAFCVIAIAIDLILSGKGVFYSLQQSAFNVSSVMTTTGFATSDFNLWPQFSRTLIVCTMFIGACAGSTAGGMKVSRIVMYIKAMRVDLHRMLHPQGMSVVRMDGKVVKKEVLYTAHTFLVTYIALFVISLLIISFDNFDLTTNFTAVAAAINNIGPGLELVGPTGNYAAFSDLSKFVLMFDMLAGRLEVFPLILLFARETWKK